MFICKAVERGDAVASLSETNGVRWAYRQIGLPNYQRVSTLAFLPSIRKAPSGLLRAMLNDSYSIKMKKLEVTGYLRGQYG